jgi:hypothetical protein
MAAEGRQASSAHDPIGDLVRLALEDVVGSLRAEKVD